MYEHATTSAVEITPSKKSIIGKGWGNIRVSIFRHVEGTRGGCGKAGPQS
jgi:hypothetical protein